MLVKGATGDVQLIRYKVCCRHNVVDLTPNPHKIHIIARPLGRGIWCFCMLKLWFIFGRHWSNVPNIMIYWTALQRHLTTYTYKQICIWYTGSKDFCVVKWYDHPRGFWLTVSHNYTLSLLSASASIISKDGEEIVNVPRGPCLCAGS